jgi:Family of unknown function (DUF5988)
VTVNLDAAIDHPPNVILDGGPSDALPDGERIRYVAGGAARVKLLRGNRYEHYEKSTRTLPHENGTLQVFVWTGSTYIAE